MRIGIIGATGNIGQRVVTEALGRGHDVIAFTRDASRIEEDREHVVWKSVDVLDPDSVAAVLPGLDVLISGFQPGNAAQDMADTVRRSIADPTVYATAAKVLLKALESRPRTRLIVIGGAGSLEIRPGVTRADSDEELYAALDSLGLPREYAAAVRGHRDALNVLRTSNRLWTYFSPAEDIAPGERTGRFRLGGDQPVLDAEGRSRISVEDAAVALVDEAELPRFVQRRFTIGY
ncbi:NAD(P)H-binding protein [Streptomyces sp. NBS 14/10]|uniref:NAD(P)-dependent oxidoreductase n=1 Tax=Streptomyces sp. NBS 14/10 TaxID=1945643 RepID=UPI000B7E6713|nr:NAD(P)H-binding protein [Streptomyces sp. NBS 14/10]KAK1181262.1 NAD(P)H-binding protein [Streptomyces sp. NBS 14/10]NUS84887.1 NAD(P)H-binding protein [Streptomyces sp.]